MRRVETMFAEFVLESVELGCEMYSGVLLSSTANSMSCEKRVVCGKLQEVLILFSRSRSLEIWRQILAR